MTAITADRGLLRTINLHVEDTGGAGRPVVLIHGWPLTGESWAPQVDALVAAGYRVITYDRRGFGRSDTSLVGYTYESLSDDLSALMEELDLRDATLVGFSMGGGEVASYCARKGTARVRSAVFAASVTPYLLHSRDNPEGPLSKTQAAQMAMSLTKNQDAFYDRMMTDVFSANGQLTISEDQRRQALAMCRQASKNAALACLTAFGNTDFREDLPRVTVPSLIIHGDADTTVPLEGSGRRTHEALRDSRLHVIAGGPHGIPISHADEFNEVLLAFLAQEFVAH
ncbi:MULTISPECIES: alpha/beta fold hydrolase [Mycolicibacterium]|uniref:Alpha/beta hydrolase fold protein n=1 Tax=Mycolicibacterium senegalense TaxID=1796 RepID=A0A378SYJ5_9MYCO|nr:MULTISPECIES: alpha/beta hydrolase [Mycolicibacterium]MCV7338560.1 alpha/beta hydrolase [Mycolicibacterium senegalense]MDR7289505.1 pimeloyl-ACP methyl ester carboxylesterase [Mycolicibacterium senegalense]QZA26338.1 alpha/beta hydrolase [Mycolicibacterium senegalense]CDP88955.1 non-heme bromoperoxidase BPO-A2 [Mycolicibacterium farcinogenes]STZ53678.1 alpha/beta hydrolase fold protein [Mycolicibacterium senegalense]